MRLVNDKKLMGLNIILLYSVAIKIAQLEDNSTPRTS